MKPLGLNEIREEFLAFFESKGHLRLQSFPLIPKNDNSLLLINSGMAPLKPYFTGQETPPRLRVATCQKCIRTGDIENVGRTARHATFFEMLGNFSFGDYFKNEAIPWSWEFMTEVMEIPADRMYASIYQDDDEAFDIWHEKVGLAPERIFRMGKDDNFWEVGLGPCGPCSEIYYDRGPEFGCGRPECTVGCDCDRYIEVWNNVFTQFNKQEDGSYTNLPKPNIDTGMGLERLATVMQGVTSIFDVDTIRAIRDEACRLANAEYGAKTAKDVSIRIITDHVRAVTFMTADGVLPSNEGRGYVLRRLLRRAALHGKLLGIDGMFVAKLSDVAIDISKGAYPELFEKRDYIHKLISVEETHFHEMLKNGMEILQGHIKAMRGRGETLLPGEPAFKLYDTFGFPLDLLKDILGGEGFTVDEAGFESEMRRQRERARAARGESNYMGADETVYNTLKTEPTEYLGHDALEAEGARILAVIQGDKSVDAAEKGAEVVVILDKTPFYAEGGGQKGDCGVIETESGAVRVDECAKVAGGRYAHSGAVTEGAVKAGQTARAAVDRQKRAATARNHSATHLLQKALREVLGAHVEQAGSYVTPERLRFDFTHFEAMSGEELARVEDIVNGRILEGLAVDIREMPIAEARELGAMALFGEKYGESVRVVNMGGYSIELCGGTHLRNTALAGSFVILSESSAAAGVRRIEALTGFNALDHYKDTEERLRAVGEVFKAGREDVAKKARQALDHVRELNAELDKARARASANIVDEILSHKELIGGLSLVSALVDNMDGGGLRALGDIVRDRLGSGALVLASVKDGKVNMVCMATDDAVKAGVHAGSVVRDAIALAGGKGGGGPKMAQAGGTDVPGCVPALNKAAELLRAGLSKVRG